MNNLKNAILLITLAITSVAGARGGSGGTTGGNPKPIEATPFANDPDRLMKLKAAVNLLQSRIPISCFPKDYNDAVLAEVHRLVSSRNVYYFPESVLLGYNRYDGDYGQEKLPNGNMKFYKVGAFTEKVKGSPIYFTKDSDKMEAEELAMTFVQDINDHILQWNNETHLNNVGAMAAGSLPCQPNDWRGSFNVFAQFPVKDPKFERRKLDFFEFFQREIIQKGYVLFGNFIVRSYKVTDSGFEFVPSQYNLWDRKIAGYQPVPIRNPKTVEVLFSPFKYVVMQNLAMDSEDDLKGLVRDPETRTVITEFSWRPTYHPGVKANEEFVNLLDMDMFCDSRELDGTNAIRNRIVHSSSRWRACTVRVDNGYMEMIMNRTRSSLCGENPELDYMNFTKTVDDYAREPYCMWDTNREFTTAAYEKIVGDRKPERFIKELIVLNESHYREQNKINDEGNVWINKNVLGGRLSLLPDMLGVVRDDAGQIYSVYVGLKGQYIRKDRIENLDKEHDWSYQCFFQGPDKGKCVERYYEN